MLAKFLHFLKTLFLTLLVLVILIAIGIAVFILTFDLNHYKGLTEEKLSDLMGRPVTIEGMHTKLALIPTVSITNFKISNNSPFDKKAPLLFIEKMDAELELIPLLNSQITIHKIDVNLAEINLYQNETANNWTFAEGTSTTETKTPPKTSAAAKKGTQKSLIDNIRLDTVSINALKLSYEDSKQKQTFKGNNLTLKQFHVLNGDIVYNNQTFTIFLNAGTLLNFLKQQPNFPIDMKVQSRLGDVNLNGRIGDLKTFSNLQATLSLQTNNFKSLLNFFKIQHTLLPTQDLKATAQVSGNLKKLEIKQADVQINSGKDLILSATGTLSDIQKNPTLTANITLQLLEGNLTELWQIQPLSLAGDITATQSSLKSNKISIDANRSDAALTLNLQKEKDLYDINVGLASNFFDLYDFVKKTEAKNTAKNTSTTDKNKSDFEIPWETLSKTKAAINLKLAHLWVGDWLNSYIGVASQITLSNGFLKAPFQMNALDGRITGDCAADVAHQNLSLNASGSALNLNSIRPLQQDIQNVVLETKLDLSSKGSTLSNLVNNLKGQVLAQVTQGTIINKWFASLPKILNLNKKKQGVTFSNTDNQITILCAAANIKINNGIISGSNQLALETNTVNLKAGGTVNLNQKTMDIALEPSLPEGERANDLLNLSKMIRISGPFDKLTPRVDTKQAANSLIQTGLNQLMGGTETVSSTITPTAGSLCQDVLGKNTLVKKGNTQPTRTNTSKAPAVSNTTQQAKQQPFQQQLLNSFFEALAPQ